MLPKLKNNPLVSCFVPTYGRPPHDTKFLEECVYWYTRQEYDNKELVIVNDAPNQQLVCDVPTVRIINLRQRITTLGAKYNYCVSQCHGDIVSPWDDDDISLPNRVPQSVACLTGMYEYWSPNGGWFENCVGDSRLVEQTRANVFHNTCSYRRDIWFNGCKYDNSVSGKQDWLFTIRAEGVALCNKSLSPREDYVRVYRWQCGSGKRPNLSGYKNQGETYMRQSEPIPGLYRIEPRMYRDYSREIQCILSPCSR